MIISKKMESVLNEQIHSELWASYMYLGMSNFFAKQGLTGFAKWMKKQSEEETSHAHKLMDYINERGGDVDLRAIAEVYTNWEDILDVFTQAWEHEEQVTKSIYANQKLAIEAGDYATQNLLNWFVNEQIEEEATAKGIVDALTFLDTDKTGVFMLNKELGARVK